MLASALTRFEVRKTRLCLESIIKKYCKCVHYFNHQLHLVDCCIASFALIQSVQFPLHIFSANPRSLHHTLVTIWKNWKDLWNLWQHIRATLRDPYMSRKIRCDAASNRQRLINKTINSMRLKAQSGSMRKKQKWKTNIILSVSLIKHDLHTVSLL